MSRAPAILVRLRFMRLPREPGLRPHGSWRFVEITPPTIYVSSGL
jgi:hypothetical protein